MSYRLRLTLLFVSIYMLLLSGVAVFIYYDFAKSRTDEFYARLTEKCINTGLELARLEQTDRSILRAIDENTIHRLYDEKVLVFDSADNLIYASLDDKKIKYTAQVLSSIRLHKEVRYVNTDGDEVTGVHYTGDGKNYVIIASANDKYGRIKLNNLITVLVVAVVSGMLLMFFFAYYYLQQIFRPIDKLQAAMHNISERNLNERLPVRNKEDDLDKIAVSFNGMLNRLDKAFELQKSFVHNASHEIKTPVAVMMSLAERRLHGPDDIQVYKQGMQEIKEECQYLSDVVNALLLTTRLNVQKSDIAFEIIRIDELLFQSIEEAEQLFPECKITLDYTTQPVGEEEVCVNGNVHLLKVAFDNLIRNAAYYSVDGVLNISIKPDKKHLRISFANDGASKLPPDIFEPFTRGAHAQNVKGHGLGLSIVRQIAQLHKAFIRYDFEGGRHIFEMAF